MIRLGDRGLKTVFVAGCCALGLFAVIASPVPRIATRAWAVNGKPEQADVIVVLGGGVTWPGVLLCGSFMRLQHAVGLYKQGYAQRILISGGRRHGTLPTEGELMRSAAIALGVRSGDLVVEEVSSRTYENGTEVAAIMTRAGWRSAVLVTDAIHMRRARLVFDRLGIETYPSASPTLGLGRTTPGEGLSVLEAIGYEAIGIVVYRLRGWI